MSKYCWIWKRMKRGSHTLQTCKICQNIIFSQTPNTWHRITAWGTFEYACKEHDLKTKKN